MHIHIAYQIPPATMSCHASLVMDQFGIHRDVGEFVVANHLELPIQPGDIVSCIGPSGSGKSSLLRSIAHQLSNVVFLDQQELPNDLLVCDALPLPAQDTFELLSACGLGEARLMLRKPSELSDGQRYRFRWAMAFARKQEWIVADEFTAMLDRTLAKVMAFNVRKLARKWGVGLLIATTHEDILDDLHPTLNITCDLDREPSFSRMDAVSNLEHLGDDIVKKKRSPRRSVSLANCGSRPDSNATGRISLGGITAAIIRDS